MSFWTEKCKPISDAMRTALGTDELIAPEKYAEKVPEIYEKGRSDEWNEFWDDYQNKGSRHDYSQAFRGVGWRGSTFKPKHNMIVTNGSYFLYASGVQSDPIDLIVLEEQGLIIDFSQCTKIEAAFSQAPTLVTIGTIDLSGMTGTVNALFSASRNIKRIKLIKMHSGITSCPSMFKDCQSLMDIEFDGEIPAALDFKSSPLTIKSLKSIITHLKNYKGTENEGTYTLTLSSDSKTLLDQEGATAPDGMTWENYITDYLGWNLA